MSAILAPFGFQPVLHTSASGNPRQKPGGVPTPPTNSVYTWEPIAFDTNGKIIPAVNFAVTPDAVIPVKGIFGGIQYSDPSGFVKQSNSFLAGTVTFNQGVSGVNNGDPYSTYVFPYIYQDPEMEFRVQASGSLTAAAIGATFDLDVTTINDNLSSQWSECALDNTVVPGYAGNFIVTQLSVEPGNQWGDAYTIVYVKLNTNF